MKNSYISLRKDVSSNKMYPKIELIRIVKNKTGEVFIDITKKANGRGVYIKPTLEAIAKVKKTKSLERGLKTSLDESIYDMLIKEVETNWD